MVQKPKIFRKVIKFLRQGEAAPLSPTSSKRWPWRDPQHPQHIVRTFSTQGGPAVSLSSSATSSPLLPEQPAAVWGKLLLPVSPIHSTMILTEGKHPLGT